MTLADGLKRVSREYERAKSESLAGHPLANHIRRELPAQAHSLINRLDPGRKILVRGTKFMGSWAYIPWVAFLDPRITETNQHGVYGVLLFSQDGQRIVLALGQGVTKTTAQEMAANRSKVLEVVTLSEDFLKGPGPENMLGSSNAAQSYEQALIAYKVYDPRSLPSDEELGSDILKVLDALQELVASPLLPHLSMEQGAEQSFIPANSTLDAITREQVITAFEEATESDWNARPGSEPFWVVRIGTEEKPLKAVFRNIDSIGNNANFNTHTAARVLRRLDFDVINRKAPAVNMTAARRSWLWAPGRGADLWTESQASGEMSIGWNELGDLMKFSSIDELTGAIKTTYAKDGEPVNDARATWDFSHEITPGDIVFAKTGQTTLLGVGVVTGSYKWDASRPNFKNARAVEWLRTGKWEAPAGEKFAIKTLTEITRWPDFIERLLDLAGGVPELAGVKLPAKEETAAPTAPTYSLEDLSSESAFPLSRLVTWAKQLQRKKHLVFQGPPGTGKTFLAKGIARALASGTSGFVETVQFHPSYSYEDFIQGIRPRAVQGGLTYEVEAGRFLAFCERARKNIAAPAVLIIDEMNRANLSRVFGELMYLLEYREDHVPLSGGGQFSVPANVFIIGTMNTADRSIALVDHALRRRFTFVHLGPDYDVLGRFLESHKLPGQSLVRVLKATNDVIRDPNYMVGVSFFMKDGPNLRSTLADVWRGEVEPYLEEYFFDQPERVSPLRFDALAKDQLKEWA